VLVLALTASLLFLALVPAGGGRDLPSQLRRSDRQTLPPDVVLELVRGVEAHIVEWARASPPSAPGWARRKLRDLAQLDPIALQDSLLECYRASPERLRLQAVALCLRAGLDTKGALLAFERLGQAAPEDADLLLQTFVVGAREERFQLETGWIPLPSDGVVVQPGG